MPFFREEPIDAQKLFDIILACHAYHTRQPVRLNVLGGIQTELAGTATCRPAGTLCWQQTMLLTEDI
jgi:hypothetical protein